MQPFDSSPTSFRPVCQPPPRYRILHADDNPMLGEVVVALFRQRGHFVEHAVDGLIAWDRWSSTRPPFDVVVTDHEMPGLRGLDLVQQLRAAGFVGRVVVYSSHLTDFQTQQYRASGADAIVLKSAKPDELVHAVEKSPKPDEAAGGSTVIPSAANLILSSAVARR